MNLYESIATKLKESTDHKTFNYNGTECWMEIGSYSTSPTVMAIQFMCSEGPYTTATVNLGEDSGNNSVIPFGATFLDTNNNSDIVDFFKKEGLGEVYTRFGEEVTMQSGFCEYPLFQFNVNKLKEYDPKGFSKYESSYRANLEKARSKVIEEAEEVQRSDFTLPNGDKVKCITYRNAGGSYHLSVSSNYETCDEYCGDFNDLSELDKYVDKLSKSGDEDNEDLYYVNYIKESSTEQYWDATELDREGFYALLKFNHPEEHKNPSMQYIITNDNNEVYRFAMQGEDENTKDTGAKIEFRKYINKGE